MPKEKIGSKPSVPSKTPNDYTPITYRVYPESLPPWPTGPKTPVFPKPPRKTGK